MSLGRILITGVNGVCGRYLSSYLLKNYPDAEIIGLDMGKQARLPSLKFLVSDITDFGSIRKIIINVKPNIIFHFAGTFNQTDIMSLYKINVLGTENLLKAVTFLSKKTRIILAGTAAVYGAVHSENNPITEETEVKPVSHYGISKAAMEMVGGMYGQGQYNIEVIIARTFNLIGAGLSPMLLPGYLARKIHEASRLKGKKEIKVGNINPVRDFVDVRDAVKAYAMLAIKGEKNNIYNIASGVGIKIKDLIKLFVKNVDSNIKVISDPKRYKKHDPEIVVADISKIYNHTGWKPKITLEDSIQSIFRPQ